MSPRKLNTLQEQAREQAEQARSYGLLKLADREHKRARYLSYKLREQSALYPRIE